MSRSILFFDCFSGAAGDMILGALVALGVPVEDLNADVAALDCEAISLTADRVSRAGIAATKVHVRPSAKDVGHRGLSNIAALIRRSRLSETVKAHAVAVFERLAHAEADVHGIPVEKVHFHEVGAADSIVDIVAACTAMELMGIGPVLCSPIRLGTGTVQTAHGELPVPAPATAELLAGASVAPAIAGADGELTTPTGAALLTTLSAGFGPMPALQLEAVGYGAGTRENASLPNVLRVFVGRDSDEGDADAVVELSANLDDCTGETIGRAIEKLLAAGALDAWACPLVMKKSRPAWMLTALCHPGAADAAEGILFAETTTFGVRRRPGTRARLSRRHETVETPYGSVRIKVGTRDGEDLTASPEYDDAAAAAEAHGVPVREVLAAALTAWRARTS